METEYQAMVECLMGRVATSNLRQIKRREQIEYKAMKVTRLAMMETRTMEMVAQVIVKR